MQRPALQKCIAVALALLVWQGAAMAVGLDLLLPSPWQVACRLWSVWREPGFFATVAFSLLRISGGFALGLVGVLVLMATAKPIAGRGYLYPLLPFDGKALRSLLLRRPAKKDNT